MTAATGKPGRQFLLFLSEAAVKVRGETPPEAIAMLVGTTVETVRRFEKGRHWPRDPDRLIAAYAYAGGLADPREIYRSALALWMEHGAPPELPGDNRSATVRDVMRIAEEAAEASERERRASASKRSGAKRDATRKPPEAA